MKPAAIPRLVVRGQWLSPRYYLVFFPAISLTTLVVDLTIGKPILPAICQKCFELPAGNRFSDPRCSLQPSFLEAVAPHF